MDTILDLGAGFRVDRLALVVALALGVGERGGVGRCGGRGVGLFEGVGEAEGRGGGGGEAGFDGVDGAVDDFVYGVDDVVDECLNKGLLASSDCGVEGCDAYCCAERVGRGCGRTRGV